MGTYREDDPLATFLRAQQAKIAEGLLEFANGGGAPAIAKVRAMVHALSAAETEVLHPAFSRVQLPLEAERLLEDCRDSRAEQLEALDALAHKRAPRLRKLAAVELTDRIQHHARQHLALLLPVLASRLPRVMHRSLAATFIARCQHTLEHVAHERPETRRAVVSNVIPG